MTGAERNLVWRLHEAGSPRDRQDWQGHKGYYVATCRVSVDDIPGLIRIARKWTDPDWPDGQGGFSIDEEKTELLPVTAWRSLADLEAHDAVDPLIDLLFELNDASEDWTLDELPCVFGRIGAPAIPSLMSLAGAVDAPEHLRSVAAIGMRYVAEYHHESRDPIVAHLTELLSQASPEEIDFNTTLLCELVELKAVEAAETIERAFSHNLLDIGMMGDWEEVKGMLGVKGLGLKMPEKSFNSMDILRIRMGMGVFSKKSIFQFDGRVDQDAARAYYLRAEDAFSASREGQEQIQRHGRLVIYKYLLQFGVHELREIVDGMSVESVEDFVFEQLPHRGATVADARAILDEMIFFWEFMAREYTTPNAIAIVERLKADGQVDRLRKSMSDPSNFCHAKSIFLMGLEAGFDMNTPEGLAEFNATLKAGLLAKKNSNVNSNTTATSTVHQPAMRNFSDQPLGRNEVCRCGSGRKFKKCCGAGRG